MPANDRFEVYLEKRTCTERKIQFKVCSNLYTRKNVRKLTTSGDVKKVFFKTCSVKSGRKIIFFPHTLLRNYASWGCRNPGNAKLQHLQFMTRIMLEEKKFKKVSKVKDLKFWRQSPPKIVGLNLKYYFDEKNKISKKSKFKSESPSFFQKRNQKIENLDKNPVKLVYLQFYFFILAIYINRRWKKRNLQ